MKGRFTILKIGKKTQRMRKKETTKSVMV